MTPEQHVYVARCVESNPGYVVQTLERVDGKVIVEVRARVDMVSGRWPADGLKTMGLVLINVDGRPE